MSHFHSANPISPWMKRITSSTLSTLEVSLVSFYSRLFNVKKTVSESVDNYLMLFGSVPKIITVVTYSKRITKSHGK